MRLPVSAGSSASGMPARLGFLLGRVSAMVVSVSERIRAPGSARTSKGLDAMKTRTLLAAASLLAVFLAPGEARAQQKGGVITINEVTIVGRVQKPVASVDVSKIQPKLTLAELRQPFLDRIDEAARRDPF